MKIYINDTGGNEWAYDTNQHRFYLNDPEVEKELGETNGEICDVKRLRSLIVGPNAAWDFDQNRALNFLRIVYAVTE